MTGVLPRSESAEVISERFYKYELGHKRPDGRFNVWTKAPVRGPVAEWVIVHVADNRLLGLRWIRETLEQERMAA